MQTEYVMRLTMQYSIVMNQAQPHLRRTAYHVRSVRQKFALPYFANW